MERRRILIVEDSPTMRQLLVFALRRLKHVELVEAQDGMDGLRKVSSDHFDLALIDINMPGTNGFDLLDALRERVPGAQVILISGDADAARMARGQHAGALACLAKPFDADEQDFAHRFIFKLSERHPVLLQEPDQVLARDAAVLRAGNPVAAEATGVKPFADGAGCNFTDLGYLTSSEDRPHCGLSNHIRFRVRGCVAPSGSSPQLVCRPNADRIRWPALLAIGSMA